MVLEVPVRVTMAIENLDHGKNLIVGEHYKMRMQFSLKSKETPEIHCHPQLPYVYVFRDSV